jgi:L-cystine uptake protein TcyP (sodium:dicarboxylate symporter family)
MKKIFFHGIIAGLLSATASVIYCKMYQTALGTSFEKIVNASTIIGASIFGCMLMSIGYFILLKFKKEKLTGMLNVLIFVLSFASSIVPITITLPLDIEAPELFPGLVVPMHFLPALAFFAIAPFFRYTVISNTNNA